MNPWRPDDSPRQARRIGKTLEELSELSAVLARISIQGLDGVDPASGKTNRVRLLEEFADVRAQIFLTEDSLSMTDDEHADGNARVAHKIRLMLEWERHFDRTA